MTRLIIAILLLPLGFSGWANAQQLTLSPYSRYGVGDINPGTTPRNMAMGNLGVATMNYASINRLNPASYADLFFTTMDFSGFGQSVRMKSRESVENQFTSGFQSIMFGFPTNKNLVLSFGFAPYSAVGYKISSVYEVEIADTLQSGVANYLADGGLNQAYIGFATWMLKKKLKLGLNGFYSFGNTTYQWQSAVANQSVTTYTDVQVERKTFLGGAGFQAGIIYADTLSGQNSTDLGGLDAKPLVLWRLGANMEYNSRLFGDRITTFTNRLVTDTIGTLEEGRVAVPTRYGVGFAVTSPGMWEFSAEFHYQDWNKFEYFSEDIGLGDGYRIAAGGEWIPKIYRYQLLPADRLPGRLLPGTDLSGRRQ